MEGHHNLRCQHCNQQFDQAGDAFYFHINNCQDKGEIQCDICKMLIPDHYFEQHMSVCRQVENDHQAEINESNKFDPESMCMFCSVTYSDKNIFGHGKNQYHAEVCHRRPHNTCPFCGHVEQYQTYLQYHIDQVCQRKPDSSMNHQQDFAQVNQSAQNHYSQPKKKKNQSQDMQESEVTYDPNVYEMKLANGFNQQNCFINSIIQPLFKIPVLRNAILTSKFKGNGQSHKIRRNIVELFQTAMKKHDKDKTIPELDIRPLRRELFIFDETTEMESIRFQPFAPGDPSYLSEFLEILHMSLNSLDKEENPDCACFHFKEGLNDYQDDLWGNQVGNTQPCDIHKALYLQTFNVKYCPCDPNKRRTEYSYINNFVTYIQINPLLEQVRFDWYHYSKQQFEHDVGTLMKRYKKSNTDQFEGICINNNDHCRKSTINETYIKHCSDVMMFNISWLMPQVSYEEIIKLLVILPIEYKISDVFDRQEDYQNDEVYVLRAVVCYLGAHFFTYMSHVTAEGQVKWRLYNDSAEIVEYDHWYQVCYRLVETLTQPKILVYEKFSGENSSIVGTQVLEKHHVDSLKKLRREQIHNDFSMGLGFFNSAPQQQDQFHNDSHQQPMLDEFAIEEQLIALKELARKEGIYFYQCSQNRTDTKMGFCQTYISLDQQECHSCKQRNIYYDEKIKVDSKKKAEVLKLLSDFEKMQGFEQKVVNKEININFGFEDHEEQKNSRHQSQRAAAGDYHQEGGMLEDQIEDDSDEINYWQCPRCEKPNLFDDENSKCKGLKLHYGYVNNCLFKLEHASDRDEQEMWKECKKDQFKQLTMSWQSKHERRNFWKCAEYKCEAYNHFYHSICQTCSTKNDKIDEIRNSMNVGKVDPEVKNKCQNCQTDYYENQFPYSCIEEYCPKRNWFCTDCCYVNNHENCVCICGRKSITAESQMRLIERYQQIQIQNKKEKEIQDKFNQEIVTDDGLIPEFGEQPQQRHGQENEDMSIEQETVVTDSGVVEQKIKTCLVCVSCSLNSFENGKCLYPKCETNKDKCYICLSDLDWGYQKEKNPPTCDSCWYMRGEKDTKPCWNCKDQQNPVDSEFCHKCSTQI